MSYIRQDKCCDTCQWLTKCGCWYGRAEHNELNKETNTFGTNCEKYIHFPLTDDEQEIVRLETENEKLRTSLREVLAHVENGTTWYPDKYKAMLEG